MSGTEASQPKQFASLGPMLLARKGSAKPAMRPQLGPIVPNHFPGNDDGLGDDLADAQNLLGWNDMGEDVEWPEEESDWQEGPEPENPAASLTPMTPTQPEPSVGRDTPEIRRQQAKLVERIAASDGFVAPARKSPARGERTAKGKDRLAAFTLRLDQDRHLKLRLASTVVGESAQKLVTRALDRLLDSMPEIDSLAAQVRRD